jgi:hypothetical protein
MQTPHISRSEVAAHIQSLPRVPPTLDGVSIGDIPIKYFKQMEILPFHPIPLDCDA